MNDNFSADSTEQVIARALSGDRIAYRKLYDDHVQLVMRLCASFHSLDADDADDVVQDTFVRAFRSLSRLKSPETFRPWLLSIARNRALTRMTEKGRAVERAAQTPTDELTVEILPEGFQLEAAVGLIDQLIGALPDGPTKETICLYYVAGGLTTREIGERQNVGKSTVTMRLERFRERVRRELTKRLIEAGLVGS